MEQRYHSPSSQGKKDNKGFKSQGEWVSAVKQYLPVMTGPLYIYELTEAVTDPENLHNIESNMSPAQVGKGLMKSYS